MDDSKEPDAPGGEFEDSEPKGGAPRDSDLNIYPGIISQIDHVGWRIDWNRAYIHATKSPFSR
jgi:hypothetical protein